MIALFGNGKTTQAIAQRFKKAIFFEDIPQAYHDENGFLHLPSEEFDPQKSPLEIPSPGIPPTHPLIKSARHLISEYDLFAHEMPYSIWISGTNGKTTTTQMITYLLADKGAQSGGNIGTPLAKMSATAPIWVLETSSFTLHYTKIAKPNLYVLLPITPDHISWHGSYEAYEMSKLKPIFTLKEGEIALVPQKYANLDTKGTLIGYKDEEDLAKIFDLDPAHLPFKGAFLMDALLALAVEQILFGQISYEKMAKFCIDPHKQEEFYDHLGRVWVDDSKATNIDATLQAILRYEGKRLYLILGGDNKGVSLEPLIKEIPKDCTIYAIGSAAPHIMELATKYDLEAFKAKTLDKAVDMIKQVHDTKSIALLSPACASLDQFSGYTERGKLFKHYVLS